MTMQARLLDGFDDPGITDEIWNDLLRAGGSDILYLTRCWQRAWWDTFGTGQLCLVAAEQDGRVVALAPLYAHDGMLFFVGTGNADYLDVIGDVSTPDVLAAMLQTAASATPGFCGIRLFGVRAQSRTGSLLQAVAPRLGWWCYSVGQSPCTRLDLKTGRAHALTAANGPKVSKRERYFERQGALVLRTFTDPADIKPRLQTLFDQHVARWTAVHLPSQFSDPTSRRFYDHVIDVANTPFQPRLTWLEWRTHVIACEFAWVYRDVYFAVVSSFDPQLALRSPGQVLQRQIILTVLHEGLSAYDFGEGDYEFKRKYATEVSHVETWELCPMTGDDTEEAGPC